MQLLKSIGVIAVLVTMSFFVTSCGTDHSHEHDHEGTEAHHGEGKEYNSAYICPMHCEGSGGEEAGACPVCGMTYVTQAEHAKDGHSH